ncbi:MAG: hypothetical protein WCS60_09080, partial [Hydrogenophaga sp.]
YFSAGTERGNGWQRSLLGVLGLDGVPGAASHEPMPADMKPGAGLGLDIVRTLAQTYGGGIEALASPLGGARLRLCLPAADGDAHTAP